MWLKKLKSNHTLNFILFPLLGILFWLKNLVFPKSYQFYSGEEKNLLYFPVHELLQNSVLLQNFVALVLVILLAFIILQINNRYNFIRIRTMIPATLFVIMAGGFTAIHALHPVHFGAVFFLIALYRLFSACDKPLPYSAAFDAGFFLGISALFYFNLILMLPAFWIGIGILGRETKFRNFVVMFIGFILPFVFGASYAFYNDSIPKMLEIIRLNILTPNEQFSVSVAMQIYSGFLLILTLLGSIKIIKEYDTKKVSSRKFFIIFFLIFLFSVCGLIFMPAVSQEMLLITLVPFTFLTTNFFVFLKNRFWGEFLFILLFVIVIVLQIIS